MLKYSLIFMDIRIFYLIIRFEILSKKLMCNNTNNYTTLIDTTHYSSRRELNNVRRTYLYRSVIFISFNRFKLDSYLMFRLLIEF